MNELWLKDTTEANTSILDKVKANQGLEHDIDVEAGDMLVCANMLAKLNNANFITLDIRELITEEGEALSNTLVAEGWKISIVNAMECVLTLLGYDMPQNHAITITHMVMTCQDVGTDGMIEMLKAREAENPISPESTTETTGSEGDVTPE